MENNPTDHEFSFIEWEDKFSVGHEGIDSQHRIIVDLLNKLFNALDHKTGELVLGEILMELNGYVQTHFEYEEQVMISVNYEKYEVHRKVHQGLTRKVNEITVAYSRKNQDLAFTVFQFLKFWLLDHIQKMDKAIGPAIIKNSSTSGRVGVGL
jgi:hemerythrin